MKQQIINLWKESFGDSDEFIKLFFSRVYKEENTLTIIRNNRVISALQIVPYKMTFGGTKIPVGYICGVCTDRSERGKGWMKQLMHDAINEMNSRKYALTTLIPASEWLFDYYRKFGYSVIFDKSEEIHTRSFDDRHDKIRILPATETTLDQAYNFYNSIQQKRKSAILHSAYDFETIRKDCILDNGNAWIALQDNQVTGLALAVPANTDQLIIKEIVYEHPDIKTGIIQLLLDHLHKSTAIVRIPPTPSDSEPYGMARILDKELLLTLYRSSDPHSGPDAILHSDNDAFVTQTIFHYNQRQPFMNLMLD